MHGPYLRDLFPSTGALEPQLVTQVDQLDREGDGARKAMSLHGLLKLLIGEGRDNALLFDWRIMLYVR
jgi:hypothetical protein